MRWAAALRLLAVAALVCALAAAAAADTRLPGWDFIGRTVNAMRTGYADSTIRDQLKYSENRVLTLSSDTKPADTRPAGTDWVVARNTISTFYPWCEWHAEAQTVRAVFDFQKELGLAFSVNGATEPTNYTDSISGTLGVSYASTSEEALAYTSFLFDSLCRCQDFRVDLKPNQQEISSSFKSAVLNLPQQFDARDTPSVDKYLGFFEQWGTHVVEGFTSGGTITQRFKMAVADYLDFQTQGLNIQAEVEAEFSLNVNVSVPVPDSHESFTGKLAEYDVQVTGGDETIHHSFQQWRPTVADDPAPLQLLAYPVFEYLTRRHFGSSSNIETRQASMNNALQYYLQFNANYPDLLPATGICRRQSAKQENECEALCPPDSVVLGGACKVQDYPPGDTQLPWRLTISKKSDNGWLCRSADDYGSGAKGYHRKVYSLALCARKKISSDMGPPAAQGIQVQTTMPTCESYGSEEGSVCSATCPPDFLLTGGGCEPSDTHLFNTSFPMQVAASAPDPANPRGAWRCAIRTDTGGSSPKQSKAQGFAVCTNWTSTFQFRPAHYSYEMVWADGHGGTTATAAVRCPDGFVVVGGGCDALMGGSVSDAWRVSRSWPYNNGWKCEGAQDAKSGVTDRSVRAYAACMRFNVAEFTP